MDLRPHIRRFLWFHVGNGLEVNAWEDNWLRCGHLSGFIPYRTARSLSISDISTVADLVENSHGGWPDGWLARFADLVTNPLPTLLDGTIDRLVWRNANGDDGPFSVREAYSSLDGPRPIMSWHASVWFKGHIPKHGFCMWIACMRRHPTQDRLRLWQAEPPDMQCALCLHGLDSHAHLFFDCPFSKEVWDAVLVEVGWGGFQTSWDNIIVALGDSQSAPKNLKHRLALSAAVYFVWQERNRRTFTNVARTAAQVTKEIVNIVMDRVAWKNSRKKIADVVS